MIRLIDLPGIRDLENAQVLANRMRGTDHGARDRMDAVSRAIFGITEDEAEPPYPDNGDEAAYAAYDEAWDRLDAADLSGWDFNDDHGREMLIADRFRSQVAAVVAGVAGKAPDIEAAATQSWAEKMEAEARKFRSTKRRT